MDERNELLEKYQKEVGNGNGSLRGYIEWLEADRDCWKTEAMAARDLIDRFLNHLEMESKYWKIRNNEQEAGDE